jgi:hypothetical protein
VVAVVVHTRNRQLAVRAIRECFRRAVHSTAAHQ